jgi:hypothetical protein
MRLNAKVGVAAAIGALAMTGPAVAQACNNGQGNQVRDQGKAQFGHDQGNQSGSNHGQFTRFGRRGRSFGRSKFGVLVSWTATQTGTNTYSGSITVSKPAFQGDHANWKSGSSSGSGSTTPQTTQVTYTFTNAKVFFGQGANPPAAGDLVKVIGARLGHCQSTGTGTSNSTGNVRAIFIAAPRSSSQSSSSQS